MTIRPFRQLRLVATALLAIPALALAVPPSTSPYNTDPVNSYVQDQVSLDMEELNGFLCFISAMAPNLLVNEGNYIALVDQNTCFNQSSGGGQKDNISVNYLSVQANSSRASNTSPMLTKIWLDYDDNGTSKSVSMQTSAAQAPSASLPYGIFRMDYCKKNSGAASCNKDIGYIDATKTGLAFYTSVQNGTNFNEFALQLSANSLSNSGSGIVIKTNNNNNTVTTSAIVFAHSPDYFYRDDGVNPPQCFNRSSNYAEESTWRYGLYFADSGEQFKHLFGFPIEYTYSSANQSGTGTVGTTYNGYISYYGLWMPVTLEPNAKVNQITYDKSAAVKKEYTLLQSEGRLTKYTTKNKTLKDMHKLPFWVYPYADVVNNDLTVLMWSYNNYEIYWDNVAQKFFVSGDYNYWGGYMEKLSPPIAIDNAAMVSAYLEGMSGWSEQLGGEFNIKSTDFAQLVTTKSATRVITQTQNAVYPKDFAALNAAGGLKCISDCPTKNQIAIYNNNGANYYDTPFVSPSSQWTLNPADGWYYYSPLSYPTLDNYTYTFNVMTGNMLDNTGAAVLQKNSDTIYSGKLVTVGDLASIQAAKAPSCINGCFYNQEDIDLLNTSSAGYSYYIWETSTNSWSQMAFLLDAQQNAVTFYPPLQVAFKVPNTDTYSNLAGTNITLEYGDFGSLWGIPDKCIDLTSNTDCVFYDDPYTSVDESTPYDKQRWVPQFSIPFSRTEGYVISANEQGISGAPDYIAAGTKFLVKALDKEMRLAQVPIGICTVLGLTEPISVTKLPSAADWIDPTKAIGTKPVLNPSPAPRVIHGVKQY